jgi:hypothetical protein
LLGHIIHFNERSGGDRELQEVYEQLNMF